VAKAVNCTNLQDGDPCDACAECVAIREGTTLDVLEIDAASNRGINEVRELRDRLAYPPGHLRKKVYILDEAHQVTKDAWNALLKSIEEPPDFVLFMFASTEPSGFPPAILSRLQRYDVRRLTVAEIEGKLRRILEADARTADDAAIVDGFLDALLTGDVGAGVDLLDGLEARGRDVRALLDQVVETVRLRLMDATVRKDAATGGALAGVARRLIEIDPDRAGIGGLRLQLELALFAGSIAGAPLMSSHAEEAASPSRPSAAGPGRPAVPVMARSDAIPSGAATITLAPDSTVASAPDHAVAPELDPAVTPVPDPPGATTPPIASAIADPPDVTLPDADPLQVAPPDGALPEPAPPADQRPRPSVESAVPVGPSVSAVSQASIGATALEIDGLVAAWPGIIASVSAATKAVLRDCRPLSIDRNVVTLGYPEGRDFLQTQTERRRPDIEAAIGTHLGRAVSVRPVAANIEAAPMPSHDDLVAEARRIFADDLVDVGEVS
jgi:DNA polymerase-3 subunit gamma/tau